MDESNETIPTDPPAEMDAEELAEAYQQTVELLGRLKACETARASTASTAPKGLADRVQKAVRVLRGDPPTTSTDELEELARLADDGSDDSSNVRVSTSSPDIFLDGREISRSTGRLDRDETSKRGL